MWSSVRAKAPMRPGRPMIRPCRLIVIMRGNHQVRPARDVRPVGQIVVVGIAVIQKTAGFNHQSTCVGAWPTGVPAQRTPADHARDDLDVTQHIGTFRRLGNELVVDPALAVAGDLKAALHHGLGRLRVALQRHSHGIDRGVDTMLAQQAHDLPESDAAAIFKIGFHIQVARVLQRRSANVGQYRF
jgi:hypothetical protein